MSLRGRRVAVRSAAQSTRHLVVVCGSAVLAFPADLVHGILTAFDVGSQTALTVLNETYPVAELRVQLGLPLAAGSSPEARTVLCSSGVCRRAFRVDQVLGLTEVEHMQVLPLPSHFRGAEREWFAGLFLYLDVVALIVNPDWLLNGRLSPLPSGAIADRQVTNAREKAIVMDTEKSHPAVLVSSLSADLKEANDAEDTPWAQV